MTTASPSEQRERLIVGVLAAAGMLSSLQFSLIVPALPELPVLLGASTADTSWVLTITLLAGTVGAPIIARLADMYGRRRMLLLTLVLLVIGSIIAPLGMNLPVMLVGRALQGIAMAILPIGISLLSSLVSPARAKMGIALMSATLGIGSTMGLALSGVLTAWGGLYAVFWFSAILGIAFIVLIFVVIDEVPTSGSARFDVLGALMLTGSLACLLLVISQVVEWGLASPIVITLTIVAIVVFALWVPYELRHPAPVVDVRLAVRSPILQINIASFVGSFGMYANFLLTMQEARGPVADGMGLGLPIVTAGLVLTPSALAMIMFAPAAGRMLNRHGGKPTLIFGSAVMAAAFMFRAFFHGGLAIVLLGSLLVGVGVAFAFAAMPALILASSPPAQAAATTGVNTLSRALAGAVASAAFALVLTALPSTMDSDYLSDAGLTVSFLASAAMGAVTVFIALFIKQDVTPQKRNPGRKTT